MMNLPRRPRDEQRGPSARWQRPRLLVVAGSLAVLASGLGGWAAAGHRTASGLGTPARLARVIHPVGAGTGIAVVAADGQVTDLAEGASIPCGTRLATDPRTRVRLERILIDYGIHVDAAQWTADSASVGHVTLQLHLPRHHLRELLDDLVSIPEVQKIREEPTSA